MEWKEIEGRWNRITSQEKPNLGEPTNDQVAVIVPKVRDDTELPPGEPVAHEAAKAALETARQAAAKRAFKKLPSIPPPP